MQSKWRLPMGIVVKSVVILLMASAALLVSCEREIPYKGPDEDPKMVVNCIAVADSAFAVRLERSQFFLDDIEEPYPITSGAVVELTDLSTGLIYTSNEVDSIGRYVLPLTAVAGRTYSIKVTHPDYDQVTAQTTVPVPVEILTMDTVLYNSEFGGVRAMATITFQDVAGQNDYYGLTILERDSVSPFYDYTYESWVMLEDPLVESQSNNRVFFTDEKFDGDLKTLKFSYDYRVLENPKPLKVRLFSCNEETFKYFLAVERATNSGPFTEPVKVPSNVNSGYGFFGAMSVKQRLF